MCAQYLGRISALPLTYAIPGRRTRLCCDDEAREGFAFEPRQPKGLEECPGRIGTDHGACPVFAAEAEHRIGDVLEAPTAVNDVKVEDTTHAVAGEDDVLAMEVRMEPSAGKPVHEGQGKVPGEGVPPPAKVRNRVVLHRRRGEVGSRSMNVRQASRRVLQLRPVAVAVGIPL